MRIRMSTSIDPANLTIEHDDGTGDVNQSLDRSAFEPPAGYGVDEPRDLASGPTEGLYLPGNSLDGTDFFPTLEGLDEVQREVTRRVREHFTTATAIDVVDIGDECTGAKNANIESHLAVNDCIFSNEVLKKWPDELRLVPSSSIALWIDPLDGTAEFTRGHLESVTTLIVPGQGNLETINRPKRAEEDYQEEGLRVCTTRTKTAPVVVAAFDNLGPKTVTLKHGGAGRKFLDVLTGVADAYLYPRPGTKRWDSCAGEALLTAIGGNVTDAIGNRIEYKIYYKNDQRPEGQQEQQLTNGADCEHPYLNGYGIVASIRGSDFHYNKLLPAVYKAVADYAPQFPLSEERKSEASSLTA
ncbi:3'(2'), 5'-bisphosphate nucleotidase 1 [Perkinsus chesapeaki]|uniref:3'(2'),5'-bisphosphate nucleotidase 1 n=1 Tax=Perkinsus chesapeaki TaxID=330153 RepID=A0A7J6M5U7_PERCH|nr:3'(2'), 5'-bisphosphate nucleotidase 1 [Perkinsus chesapeaki]